MDEKILIIDSHPVYGPKIDGFLKGLTFKNVLMAKNGEEGLAMAETQLPRLIILSSMLSDMDGVEVCQRLKRMGLSSKIIVLVGLFVEQDEVDFFLKYGADKVLMRKEKDLSPLEHSIEELLGSQPSST